MPDRRLRYVAAALAAVVAVTHLYWALPRLARQLHYGTVPDPRPAAFLLAVFAMVLGASLVVQGFDPRPIYLGGMVLMAIFIAGYAAWHTVLDHGGFWPGRHAHGHDAPFLSVVYSHLVDEPLELVSKIAEAALLIVLGALYARERTDE